MQKIIEALKPIPKLYWIYAVAVLIAEAAIFATRPDEPGLYTQNLQFMPVAIAAAFFILRPIRKNFRLSFYTYTVLAFLFLALDYLTQSHAGLVQISVTFLPAFLFWMLLFIRWNYHKFREPESRQALLLSLIAWAILSTNTILALKKNA